MRKLVLALFLLALFTMPAYAEDNQVSARAWGGALTNADLDGHGGGYSQSHAGVALGWRWLTLTYVSNSYSWDNVNKMPFGDGHSDPWRHLNTLDLDAKFNGQISENLSWFAGANMYSGWEKQISNSFGFGGRVGIDYQLGGDWRLRLGAMLMLHKVGLQVFPMVGLSWRQPEQVGWSLSLGSPITMVQYRFSPLLALRAGGHYQYGVYRLADDSPVYEQGYVVPRSIVAGVYAQITPLSGLNFIAGVEGSMWRRLNIYDDGGDRQDTYDVDPAMGFVLRMNYGF